MHLSAMKFWRRKKARKLFLKNGSHFLQELIADCNGVSNPIRVFTSDQILKSTDQFNPTCSLFGQGLDWFDPDFDLNYYGFFTWYKGVIEDRPYVIRELIIINDSRSSRDEPRYNDIVLSARVSNHSGFLKLIGCCLEFQFLVVVFENLEYRVMNNRGSVGPEDSALLPWNVRLKIAKEVATAITYLHTAFPRIIIHRDIKATNVLLDRNWNAKLTNFSISVTLPEGKTWIEDKAMGTLGYIDLAYINTGLVTEYTDVFSFGIFMLVLLTGRPAYSAESGEAVNILDYVKDPREMEERVGSNDVRVDQMKMFLELALRCCAESNQDRPKMIQVAKEIKMIERSLDCNVLETDGKEEEEAPLAVESQGVERPLDLLTPSSLDSWWDRSNCGFIVLGFVFSFVFALFIGNQFHSVTYVTQF